MYITHITSYMCSRSVQIQEEAVSPVIGTLLILAITIVLIAVICGVALGFFSGMFSAKNVGATLTPYETQDEYGMEFLLYSGADAKNITSVRVLGSGVTFAWNGASSVENPQIGVSYRFHVTGVTAGVLGSNMIVTAVGTFADGEEVVLVQTRMTVLGDGNNDVVVTENGYLKVMFGTYSNTTYTDDKVGVIPGRGVYIQILDILNSSVTKVKTFTVAQPNGVQIATPGSNNQLKAVANPQTGVNYYFYAVLSQYWNFPYKERAENPAVSNLKINGTFSLTVDGGSGVDVVERQSVNLPARQVIFTYPELVAGTVERYGSGSSTKINVTITQQTLEGTIKLEVYVLPDGTVGDVSTEAKRLYSGSMPSTSTITLSPKLDSLGLGFSNNSRVDVLVKKEETASGWSAWYRVGSTTVGALRGT